MSLWKDIAISVFIMLALDAVWILLIMRKFYFDLIRNIQGEDLQFNFIAACLCYITLEFGLIYFVIMRIKKFDFMNILYLSVPYGLVTYGTYDFTSATVLKKFGLLTCLIDVLWGILLMSTTAICTIFARRFYESDNSDIIEEEDRIK